MTAWEKEKLVAYVLEAIEYERRGKALANMRQELSRSRSSIQGTYVISGRQVTVDYGEDGVEIILGETVIVLDK